MSHGEGHRATIPSADLREALEALVWPGHAGGLTRLERRDSLYSSSHTLQELDLGFADGTALKLMFKDLGRQSLLPEARHAKPAFLHDPRREIETYRTILANASLGTAHFHGAVCDGGAGRYWLFVERIAGEELYQIGDFAFWEEVARWLARMHAHFAGAAKLGEAPLLRHDLAYYRQWPLRAREFLRAVDLPAGTRGDVERVLNGHERVIERLLTLPGTLVHGDFYAANVLVQQSPGGLRVCPIDWELAGIGPGLIDLAALTAGKWSAGQKEALALAYHEALPAGSLTKRDFATALDCCRLQCAVQWLGWSADWSPPSAQAHDWIGEALELAARLDI
jgi:hypothetical protein